MSPLELHAPETVEAIPFSVRLAERRLAERESAARAARRAHLRRAPPRTRVLAKQRDAQGAHRRRGRANEGSVLRRDFEGNPKDQEKASGTRGQGRRVEVTFADGEVVLGTTLNYRPDTQGFFVSPADPASNNTRIFVVTTALGRVRFL